jgi:hypothetical protein
MTTPPNHGKTHTVATLETPPQRRKMPEDAATSKATKAAVWVSQIATPIVAIVIALSVCFATVVITNKLGTTEENLQRALSRDTAVCADAGMVKTYCLLEQDLTQRRYVLAASGVTAALWTRYFICLGGLIMVAVGSIFILMKLEIKQGEAKAKGAGWGIDLRTSSPGLALALIGGGLLAAAAYTPTMFKVSDGPSFLRLVNAPQPTASDPETNDHLSQYGKPPGPVAIPTKDEEK